jgi:hypothetical protein
LIPFGEGHFFLNGELIVLLFKETFGLGVKVVLWVPYGHGLEQFQSHEDIAISVAFQNLSILLCFGYFEQIAKVVAPPIGKKLYLGLILANLRQFFMGGHGEVIFAEGEIEAGGNHQSLV